LGREEALGLTEGSDEEGEGEGTAKRPKSKGTGGKGLGTTEVNSGNLISLF
jgi:hypothetical protein